MEEARYCRFCGAELPSGVEACPNCGRIRETPTGIAVISVLSIIAGILGLLGGLGLIMISGFFIASPTASALFFQMLAVSIVVGGIARISGGLGLLKLKLWGWWLAMIGAPGAVAFSIFNGLVAPLVSTARFSISFPIVGIIPEMVITPIVLAYLFAKRRFFGKVTKISKPLLAGLVVFALLPLILSGIGFTFIAPQLAGLRVLPPLEPGWQEVTFNGTGDDSFRVFIGSEWRLTFYAVAAGEGAHFTVSACSISLLNRSGASWGASSGVSGFTGEKSVTLPSQIKEENWGPPGEYVIEIETDNVREWTVRIEERV